MSVAVLPEGSAQSEAPNTKLVIVASSLGTVFEWYDFFVYGTLAVLLGNLFFPSDNESAALLKSLAAFGVGFGVRPLGAIIFGHLGDLVGRKYTFLVTITLMGVATAGVGFLPTYAEIGVWAPILLLFLRVLQGMALGGEYGGAAIYVAEHAPPGKRGFYTSFIQVSVVGGFMLSLAVVLGFTALLGKEAFNDWGWRLPFLFSLLLLAISLYIRLKLSESPVFQAMKEAGTTSKNPLKDSFAEPGNVKRIFVAMFGIAAGLTVIWYTAQFQTLYFLQQTTRIDTTTAQMLIGLSTIIAAPSFVFFGWLSDKVGRKPPMVVGYVLTLSLLFPLFHMIANAGNPALAAAMARAPVTISNADCDYNPFAEKGQDSDCGKILDYFAKQGVGYTKASGSGAVIVTIGSTKIEGLQPDAFAAALQVSGYPGKVDPVKGWQVGPDPDGRSELRIIIAVVLLGILSGMTYGPVAVILVELFPARIRYTSMSIPYHIGTGYFGGFLPFVSQYIVVTTGDVFGGLWYTMAVVLVALLVTVFLLPETRGRDVTE